MACSCHKRDKKTEEHSATPYDQCLICTEKHFSAAFTEAKEFGYIEKNRPAIIGDLEGATRHTQEKYKDLAEMFRTLRHEVQMRKENFSFEKWMEISELISEKIREEILISENGKIYVFSNVEYPEKNKIYAKPEDMLVFLNTARGIDFYKNHQNKVIFHRSPEACYGKKLDCAGNCYVFSNNEKRQIPGKFIATLKNKYDWNYPIEDGKVRCATTGYMVVEYLQNRFPANEIILVNFGYDVKKSTYRCPWHNWKFEAEELERFRHIYTEEGQKIKKKILLQTHPTLEGNKFTLSIVEKLAESGKFEVNVQTNIPAMWRNCTLLNREITEKTADHVIGSVQILPQNGFEKALKNVCDLTNVIL